MLMVWLAMGTEAGGREEGKGSSREKHMVVCDACEIRLD